jgi:hypothetical protein
MAMESKNIDDISIALGIFKDLSFFTDEIRLDYNDGEINEGNLSKFRHIIDTILVKSIAVIVELVRDSRTPITSDVLIKFYDFLLVSLLWGSQKRYCIEFFILIKVNINNLSSDVVSNVSRNLIDIVFEVLFMCMRKTIQTINELYCPLQVVKRSFEVVEEFVNRMTFCLFWLFLI